MNIQSPEVIPSKETVQIDIDERVRYEAYTKLMAVIIYPNDPAARDRFIAAVCYLLLRKTAESKQDKSEFVVIRYSYLLQNEERADKIYQAGLKILNNERMLAAKFLDPFMLQENSDAPVMLMPINEKPTMRAMAEWLQKERHLREHGEEPLSGGNPKNFEQRALAPSKPVLHLVYALHLHFKDVASETGAYDPADLYNDPEQVVEICELAEIIRGGLPYVAEKHKWKNLSYHDLIQVKTKSC